MKWQASYATKDAFTIYWSCIGDDWFECCVQVSTLNSWVYRFFSLVEYGDNRSLLLVKGWFLFFNPILLWVSSSFILHKNSLQFGDRLIRRRWEVEFRIFLDLVVSGERSKINLSYPIPCSLQFWLGCPSASSRWILLEIFRIVRPSSNLMQLLQGTVTETERDQRSKIKVFLPLPRVVFGPIFLLERSMVRNDNVDDSLHWLKWKIRDKLGRCHHLKLNHASWNRWSFHCLLHCRNESSLLSSFASIKDQRSLGDQRSIHT